MLQRQFQFHLRSFDMQPLFLKIPVCGMRREQTSANKYGGKKHLVFSTCDLQTNFLPDIEAESHQTI